MVRLALFALLALFAAVFVVESRVVPSEISPQGAFSERPLSPSSRREARVLDLLHSANERRSELGLSRLTVLPELQLALDEFAREGAEGGVERSFRLAGKRIPSIRQLSGNLVFGSGEEAVLRQLEQWADLCEAGHTHLALQFFETGRHRGERIGCIAVLASVFPEFRPPMLSTGVTAFYEVCRWCGQGHGISVAGGGQTTLVIQCPDCLRTSDLVATDPDGYWRRVTQFLRPNSQLTPRGHGSLHEVMTIWTGLTAKNRYQKDAERLGGSDSWNLPEETLRRGAGDCEDTSLLLAQLLLDRGYEVRVVLGKQAGQGHAWCVLRLDGQSYLLESTCSEGSLLRPPLVSEVALEYEPEFQFDAGKIYFKEFEGWTGEYWDGRIWAASGANEWMSASL